MKKTEGFSLLPLVTLVRYDNQGVFEITDSDVLGAVAAAGGAMDSSTPSIIDSNTYCVPNGVCDVNVPCDQFNTNCTFNSRCSDTFC